MAKLTTQDFRKGTISHGQLVDVLEGIGYALKDSAPGYRVTIGQKTFPLKQTKSSGTYDKQTTGSIFQAIARDGKENKLNKYLEKYNAPQKKSGGKGLTVEQLEAFDNRNDGAEADLGPTAPEAPSIIAEEAPEPAKAETPAAAVKELKKPSEFVTQEQMAELEKKFENFGRYELDAQHQLTLFIPLRDGTELAIRDLAMNEHNCLLKDDVSALLALIAEEHIDTAQKATSVETLALPGLPSIILTNGDYKERWTTANRLVRSLESNHYIDRRLDSFTQDLSLGKNEHSARNRLHVDSITLTVTEKTLQCLTLTFRELAPNDPAAVREILENQRLTVGAEITPNQLTTMLTQLLGTELAKEKQKTEKKQESTPEATADETAKPDAPTDVKPFAFNADIVVPDLPELPPATIAEAPPFDALAFGHALRSHMQQARITPKALSERLNDQAQAQEATRASEFEANNTSFAAGRYTETMIQNFVSGKTLPDHDQLQDLIAVLNNGKTPEEAAKIKEELENAHHQAEIGLAANNPATTRIFAERLETIRAQHDDLWFDDVLQEKLNAHRDARAPKYVPSPVATTSPEDILAIINGQKTPSREEVTQLAHALAHGKDADTQQEIQSQLLSAFRVESASPQAVEEPTHNLEALQEHINAVRTALTEKYFEGANNLTIGNRVRELNGLPAEKASTPESTTVNGILSTRIELPKKPQTLFTGLDKLSIAVAPEARDQYTADTTKLLEAQQVYFDTARQQQR